jgi:heme oxygenase
MCLQQATRDIHQHLENLPLAQAMVKGTVSRQEYVLLLSQLLPLHETLEAELQRHQGLGGIYQQEMARTQALRKDIRVLGESVSGILLHPTHELLKKFRSWSEAAPWAMLGPLYVFEGSRMGSIVLAPALAKGLNLKTTPGQGLDYHLDGIQTRPQSWQTFRTAISRLSLTSAQEQAILQTAVTTMADLHDLYLAITSPAPLPSLVAAIPAYPEHGTM